MEFLRASLSFAWLDFKALKFYPSNGVLQVIRSFVTVGIWFFVSLFLQDFATVQLDAYGGDFVAYMVVGVLFFQNADTIMTLPQQSLSAAFWDKRLEIYHSRRYGLWAFITGRFIWMLGYHTLILLLILALAIWAAGVQLSSAIHVLPAVLYYLVFVLTCFGIGLAGASNFFTLEVKQGAEPLTWLMNTLARIFSGIYYPITILPAALRGIGWFIPHTYALDGIRRVMINGTGFDDPATRQSFLILILFAIFWLVGGSLLLSRAINRAEQSNGVGIVI
jgi:ABC-2 type transport system permease protein